MLVDAHPEDLYLHFHLYVQYDFLRDPQEAYQIMVLLPVSLVVLVFLDLAYILL